MMESSQDVFAVIAKMHLDSKYYLLTAKMVRTLYELFVVLDVYKNSGLDYVQFASMTSKLTTNPSSTEMKRAFSVLDTNRSGLIDFDEFYLYVCLLIARRDGQMKQFINCHSRTVFDLLDTDRDNSVSVEEFVNCEFLFQIDRRTVKQIFQEFDVSGDDVLDYREFRMFTMACIDKQLQRDGKKHQYSQYWDRFVRQLRRGWDAIKSRSRWIVTPGAPPTTNFDQ